MLFSGSPINWINMLANVNNPFGLPHAPFDCIIVMHIHATLMIIAHVAWQENFTMLKHLGIFEIDYFYFKTCK